MSGTAAARHRACWALRRRTRRRRPVLQPAPGRIYDSSDLRAAMRRAQRLRAEALARGEAPPRGDVEATLRQARAAGLLGRRRMVTVTVEVPTRGLADALWYSGAADVGTFILVALLRAVLSDPATWRRHGRRRNPAHPGPVGRIRGKRG